MVQSCPLGLFFFHIINPLLTKLVRSKWLDSFLRVNASWSTNTQNFTNIQPSFSRARSTRISRLYSQSNTSQVREREKNLRHKIAQDF